MSSTSKRATRWNREFSPVIDEGGFIRAADEKFLFDYCEVKLMGAVDAGQVVPISPKDFFLCRPLERHLYEITRKHCGNKAKWQIGLDKLQPTTGSNAPIKRFRHNLREMIKADEAPFYRFEIDSRDLIVVRPRTTKTALAPSITLPDWAEEKGREMPAKRAGITTPCAQTGWTWPQRKLQKATHLRMPARRLSDSVRNRTPFASLSFFP